MNEVTYISTRDSYTAFTKTGEAVHFSVLGKGEDTWAAAKAIARKAKLVRVGFYRPL